MTRHALALVALGLAALAAPSTVAAQTVAPAVAFGTRHAVALRTNGEVLTWGYNVGCQLGRRAGNRSSEPAVMMRNAVAVAAAFEHSLALTASGKVYGWGQNSEGQLGVGTTNEQCEGPALAVSLAGVTVTQIATGYGFSVAVTTDGDLYCAGENDMGQCPVGKDGALVFTKVPLPELAGTVAEVRAGSFHTLIKTKDGRLYAMGRGRDGQLGNGRTINGFALVSGMTDVVSFDAGMWHSVAARADGSVWAWGNDAKSQLCDGRTANLSSPTKVALPAGVSVTQVAAGGHGTLLRQADGFLRACGDNQFGPLGIGDAMSAPSPTAAPTARASAILGLGGAHSAITSDGCDVRLAGDNDNGIVSTANIGYVRTFFRRPNLTLCAPRTAPEAGDVVNPAPRGGESGCWTTRVQEDSVTSPRLASLKQAMLAAEDLLKKNAAFLAAPQPSRFRTSIAASGPEAAGARMHVKVVPERKGDGSRLWSTGCEVIPQVDRIGGALAQISIFFNHDASFISPVGDAPPRTGTVAGYPEYGGWVMITKDGRLPWIPQTVADRLDIEGEQRQQALAEAKRRTAGSPPDDAAGGIQWLEKQVRDYQAYRASFTPEQLRAPAVAGDPSGAGRRALEAEAAAMRNLSPEDQQRFDALGLESRTLERQAQAETRTGNAAEAARLRERSRALAIEAREIRQAHMNRAAPRIIDAMAQYDLKAIQPGPADRAMKVKRDPTFPDTSNRIQVIAVMFSFGPKPTGVQLEWRTKVIESFDFAALAAMLR